MQYLKQYRAFKTILHGLHLKQIYFNDTVTKQIDSFV